MINITTRFSCLLVGFFPHFFILHFAIEAEIYILGRTLFETRSELCDDEQITATWKKLPLYLNDIQFLVLLGGEACWHVAVFPELLF